MNTCLIRGNCCRFAIWGLVIAGLGWLGFRSLSPSTPTHLPIVSILQIVEHPALDAEREGLIERLKELGYREGQNIHIDYQNAQGNLATASQIAHQALGHHPKVFVAISTPAAQAALSLCLQKKTPLVFSAVTDPLEAKLVSNLDQRNEAVTGVSDGLSATSQIEFISHILPKLKKIGVLYNPGEINSVKAVEDFKKASKNKGWEVYEGTATRTSDVSLAVVSLLPTVDAFYVPADNLFVSAMQNITSLAKSQKKPVFAGDSGSVQNGALAAMGHDRLELGKKLGDIVISILKGTAVGSIPVQRDHPLKLFTNTQTAKDLGIKLHD